MSSTPAVSVVIPTYNNPGLLLETLDSVRAQTFADYEVIVIDDGSTDDTAERLRPLAAAESRLRVVRQENGGIGAARNRGIDEARGKYVALLDHDDLWKPAKLATQVAFMEAHPGCASVTCPYAYLHTPGQCAFDLGIRDDQGIVRRPMLHLSRGQTFIMSSNLMFDRARAAGLRYATRRRCIEDVPFQIGLFGRGECGIAGDDVLMLYRFHGSNYSSQASFYFNGIRLLRDLDARGAFAGFDATGRADVAQFLAHVGRAAAVNQLLNGSRWDGLRVYLSEFPHQLRLGRGKFLATLPALACLPAPALRRRWPKNS